MRDRDTDQMTDGSLVRLLARGTGINLGGVIVRVVVVFMHSLFAARLYGAAGYGLYTEGIAAVMLLSVIAQLGMGRALTRFVALFRARGESDGVGRILQLGLAASVPLAVSAGLVLSFASKQVAGLFGASALGASFRVYGLAVPLLVMATVLASFTQGFKDMRHKTIAMDIVAPIVELAAMLLLAWLGAQTLGLSLAYTLSLAFATAILIRFARADVKRARAESLEQGNHPVSRLLGPMMRFGCSVWVVEMLMEMSRRASVLMLGIYEDTATVGIFGIVQRLVGLGGIFLLSTNLMFGPMVSDLVERRQIGDLDRLHKTSARWILGLSLPFFLLLGFYSPRILALFGLAFVSGTQALRYLIAATLVDVSTGNSGILLLMSGRPQFNAFNEAVRLLITVVLNVLWVPKHGLLGSVWAIGVGTVVFSTLQVAETWWCLRVQPYSKTFLKILIAGGFMIGFLWAWQAYAPLKTESWQWVILSGGLALVGYAAIMLAWGLDGEDREILGAARVKLLRLRRTM
jgi:O-antigen/teichoic acid export membrane protein